MKQQGELSDSLDERAMEQWVENREIDEETKTKRGVSLAKVIK